MLHESPLRKRHEAYLRDRAVALKARQADLQRPGAAKLTDIAATEMLYVPYALADQSEPACEIPASFGEMEAEYAALRRGAGLLDSPQLGTIIITGDDRRDFLNRLITQELKDFNAGDVRLAFLLSRKGRIDAELMLVELGDRILISLDVHQVAPVCEALASYLFTEDVLVRDATAELHHVAINGPLAPAVVGHAAGLPKFEPAPLSVTRLTIAGAEVAVARCDRIGEAGVDLILTPDKAEIVWDALLATDEELGGGKRRVRPVGWYAFNIARIEAGSPTFNIDFGTTNLPHESSLLHERVSFTKGCYIGQEVVARMENLGRPKQQLVGLRMQGDHLPVAGSQVFAEPDGAGEEEQGTMGRQIGIVTSSTLSPMLGAASIAFAMIRTAASKHGATVLVNAEGEQVQAIITPLQFWPEPPEPPEPEDGDQANTSSPSTPSAEADA